MDRDLSIIAQNAGTTASNIYAALVANRGDMVFDPAEYAGIREAVFNGTLELAGSEAVARAFVPTTTASEAVGEVRAAASASRPHENVTINFGKYRGQTIGQVYDSNGQGAEYIKWLAESANNDFIKKRAAEFLTVAA